MSLLRLVFLSSALIISAVGGLPVRAEDFTGFYAGVNAGYAFDRDQHEHGGSKALSDTSPDDDTCSLPPSAQSASQSPAMRSSRNARPTQR